MYYRMLITLAAVIITGVVLSIHSKAQMPNKSIVEIVQNIPLGTSRSLADSYLKKAGFESSYDKTTQTFLIMIRKPQNDLIRKDVQILLRIGQNDQISEITIKQVFTGP